ncbi:MAG: hypothetical protein V9H69_24060 [Anaerolineae bacterium]
MATIDEVIEQGYYVKTSTPEDVRQAYAWHCRQQRLPVIYLAPSLRETWKVLMSEPWPVSGGEPKPTRTTSRRVNALAKTWAAVLYPGRKDVSIELSARGAGVCGLTEDQARQLAAELWAIVGQPGAYDFVEPEEEDDEDEE